VAEWSLKPTPPGFGPKPAKMVYQESEIFPPVLHKEVRLPDEAIRGMSDELRNKGRFFVLSIVNIGTEDRGMNKIAFVALGALRSVLVPPLRGPWARRGVWSPMLAFASRPSA
jgi:hypothetical protein